jgi:hypothetical protein
MDDVAYLFCIIEQIFIFFYCIAHCAIAVKMIFKSKQKIEIEFYIFLFLPQAWASLFIL